MYQWTYSSSFLHFFKVLSVCCCFYSGFKHHTALSPLSMSAMHDGHCSVAIDHRFNATFHDALWIAMSPQYRVQRFSLHILTALPNGNLTFQ